MAPRVYAGMIDAVVVCDLCCPWLHSSVPGHGFRRTHGLCAGLSSGILNAARALVTLGRSGSNSYCDTISRGSLPHGCGHGKHGAWNANRGMLVAFADSSTVVGPMFFVLWCVLRDLEVDTSNRFGWRRARLWRADRCTYGDSP